MKIHVLVIAVAASFVSFACGGDDTPDQDPTMAEDAGTGGGGDASANGATGDAGTDAGSESRADATAEIVPAQPSLCLGGALEGPDGCVDSVVLEIRNSWSLFAETSLLTVERFGSGQPEEFPPDVKEPFNASCYYEEALDSFDASGECTDIGTVNFELGGQSGSATLDPDACYLDGGAPKPFRPATLDVSWTGGADAESGMVSGLATAPPAIDVGFATNGDFRVVREESDGYDGPMVFTVSQFDLDTGINHSLNCYTPGNETLVVTAEEIEEFGGFGGASWRAEFTEVSFNEDGAIPVRLVNRSGRSGQLPE